MNNEYPFYDAIIFGMNSRKMIELPKTLKLL